MTLSLKWPIVRILEINYLKKNRSTINNYKTPLPVKVFISNFFRVVPAQNNTTNETEVVSTFQLENIPFYSFKRRISGSIRNYTQRFNVIILRKDFFSLEKENEIKITLEKNEVFRSYTKLYVYSEKL